MAARRLVIRERITAIVGSLLLLVLVLLSYWYSIRVDIAGLKYVPSEKSPDFVASRITLTDFNEDGTPYFRAQAARLQHFSDERMHAQEASFISLRPGDARATARADELWSNDGLETVDLSGNVILTRRAYQNEPELFLRTNHLRGWLDTMHFETTHPVLLRRGIDTTEASEGMVYDNVARTVALQGNVRSVFHPQDYDVARQPASSPVSSTSQEE